MPEALVYRTRINRLADYRKSFLDEDQSWKCRGARNHGVDLNERFYELHPVPWLHHAVP